MTWSARITKADGTVDQGEYSACQTCKHFRSMPISGTEKRIMPCFLPKIASSIGSFLTSVDTGADGHMASGSAELRCNGFEPIVP